MTTEAKGLKIISADSHFSEPADLWTNYIEPRYRDRAPHVEHGETSDVFVCDTGEMLPVGVLHGVRHKRSGARSEGRFTDIPRSSWDPDARIVDIEMDGVYGEVLYPTIGMRFFTIKDIDFGGACIHAYNRWASDFCSAYPERFKAIGLIMLDDIERALGEMRHCKKLGLAGVMIAVFPDEARPYHDEHYERFWGTAAELGLPVSLHSATERRVSVTRDATEQLLRYTSVQRAIIGMIYAGVFDKFPGLQVVSAENEAGWAGNLIERMDFYYAEAPAKKLRAVAMDNEKNPSEYWHNNVSYTFMRDLTAVAARHVIGVDRLMWSSDFPHNNSTWPDSREVIAKHMVGVPADEQRMILRDNAVRIYSF